MATNIVSDIVNRINSCNQQDQAEADAVKAQIQAMVQQATLGQQHFLISRSQATMHRGIPASGYTPAWGQLGQPQPSPFPPLPPPTGIFAHVCFIDSAGRQVTLDIDTAYVDTMMAISREHAEFSCAIKIQNPKDDDLDLAEAFIDDLKDGRAQKDQ